MSNGTRGELPFYCAWHFGCGDPAIGDRVVAQSFAWDGKPESYLAMRRQRSVAAQTPMPEALRPPQREPGQDETEADQVVPA